MNVHGSILVILDSLFSSFMVAPLVISYWRGTWNLTDLYLIRENKIKSSFFSLAIGIAGHLVLTMCQNSIEKVFDPSRHRLTFHVGSRLYTSIYGVICVNGWRGGWNLIDNYTAKDLTTIIIITSVAVCCLCLLKTLRNIIATPFVIVFDDASDYFKVCTKYKMLVRLGNMTLLTILLSQYFVIYHINKHFVLRIDDEKIFT